MPSQSQPFPPNQHIQSGFSQLSISRPNEADENNDDWLENVL
jgi:hypothetical protein